MSLIVAYACVGFMALAVGSLILLMVKELWDLSKLDKQVACLKISEHLGEYMDYKESIGEGADVEKLLKKFEEISKKEHKE